MRVALLAAVVLLAGCGGQSAAEDAQAAEGSSAAQTVTVQFRLAHYDTAFAACQGQGGYSDIGAGTPVTIKNGDGQTLGAATLGKGKSSTNGVQDAFCDWTVEMSDVPGDENFYVVEIGSRGEITTSRSDLAENDWTVDVSLGQL